MKDTFAIEVDYATTLIFNNWDDFVNCIGYLLEGGVKELKIAKTSEEVTE